MNVPITDCEAPRWAVSSVLLLQSLKHPGLSSAVSADATICAGRQSRMARTGFKYRHEDRLS